MKEVETLSSKLVYENRWMRVREDMVRRADGSQGVYGVVEKRDFALIVAIEGGFVHLVEQYRHPIGARHWEFPQGSWERSDEDPLELARTELREETGLSAGRMVHAGRLYEAGGFCTQAFNVFVATALSAGAAALEPEEAGLVCARFALDQLETMIRDGVIVDGPTVAAFGLLRLKGLL